MSRYLIRAGAVAALLALVFAAVASGKREESRVGNLILADDGGIYPSTLPKRGRAPITARILGEISTIDGSHPPALRTIDLDIEETIAVDAVGLPVCKAKQIEATSTATAKRNCGEAIVGSGEAEVEVSFPEQAPFSATGPVVLFNGGVRGPTTLVLAHAYVAVPAPTAVITPATVTRINRGRYGLHIEAKIPKIAGGAGSVTQVELEIGRRFTYKGERKSFLSAGCPTGSWMTKGNVLFDDATEMGLTHVFPCTPKG